MFPTFQWRRVTVLLLSLLIILTGSSCRIIKGLQYMHKKTPRVSSLQYQDKTVRFIPMVHFGKKEYYAKVSKLIMDFKQEGYVVYYEQIKGNFNKLHVSKETFDTLAWKYRKMSGGTHTRAEYSRELGDVFKKMRVQPEYDSLGVTASDINSDVSIIDLVGKYEQLYGTIPLDSCDFNTPLDSAYNCDRMGNSIKPLIDDFRNESLANNIKRSGDKKIVVVYGFAHIRPVKKLLRHN